MLSFTILPRRVRRWEEEEARAGGMTVYRRRPPGLDEESANIFDLALDRVRYGVTAVAPAPAIVVGYSELLRQPLVDPPDPVGIFEAIPYQVSDSSRYCSNACRAKASASISP
jgi:hypothetical protein